MIGTEQGIAINAPIHQVWNFAQDISRWAGLMPGLVDYEIIDDDRSHWVLKVGVGALVRTVKVDVIVTRWAGPEAADFTYQLVGDPVEGEGSFRALANGTATDVELTIRVNGTGPMAPMWEAMGKPLLPKFARGFAEQLKERIEAGE